MVCCFMKDKKIILISLISILLFILLAYGSYNMLFKNNNIDNKNNINENGNESSTDEDEETENHEDENNDIVSPKITNVNITAVGDCTIGYDDNFGYPNSFNYYYDKYGEDHFFKGVKGIFEQDDFTLANLETTFTDYNVKTPKKFNFKAPPSYVSILNNSSIEVVNIANNHIKDYGDEGYTDTVNTLTNANIHFVGYNYYYVFEKDNIRIGLGGIHCIEDKQCTTKIDKVINDLNALNVDSIILSFHWGIEKDYKQSAIQTYLAHYAIDNGVDLVIGHHPHVLQGIECYKDKYIVYSLANFSFGGNKNPKDKDTMIFNIEYTYEDKKIIDTKVKIYPTRVSSVTNTNDYSPTVLEGDSATKVLNKIQNNSVNFNVFDHIN